MKKLLLLAIVLLFTEISAQAQLIKKIGNKVKSVAEQKETKPADPPPPAQEPAAAPAAENTPKDTTGTPAAPPALKVYANYDFVPGNRIVFEDNFTDDQDGEFPSHWELKEGQALLNKTGGVEAFMVTDGNYARLLPRIRSPKYLTDTFTIEYDYYYVPGAYASLILLKGSDGNGERESNLQVSSYNASFTGNIGGVSLQKEFPDDLKTGFENKWHHVAIALKNHQLKVYVDQYRVLVVPDTKESYSSLTFAGIGDEKEPIVFSNVRIANGGGMNMLGKKFTEAKIVTHGINFDINKATIKPESMGTLNMIVQIMKDNPDLKFEVDGHTDNTGTAQHNLTLSQQRAESVKTELIRMGVEPGRLSSKGFGDTKPVSDNSTLEGRANNRRVEFVKM